MIKSSVRGLDVFYRQSGHGNPVLLISGLSGTSGFWEPNIAALEQSHTVICYDQRGTGKTTRPEQRYSVELLAEDLVGLMDALDLPTVSLVGHSTGGAIAQVVAALYPERVDRLVLYGSWRTLSPALKLGMDMRRKLLACGGIKTYQEMSPVYLYPPEFICQNWDQLASKFPARIVESPSPSILDARMQAVLDFEGAVYTDRIRAPTLVITAVDDILTPIYCARELAASIRGARLHTLSYGGHVASFCGPEEFNNAVVAFLEE